VLPHQRAGARACGRAGVRACGRAPYSLHSRADSGRALPSNPVPAGGLVPAWATGQDVCAALSVVRRAPCREDFRQHKSITDPVKIQDLLEYGRKELTVIQRQAQISQLYGPQLHGAPSRSVLENRKARADSR
jgi:hypothetical protein